MDARPGDPPTGPEITRYLTRVQGVYLSGGSPGEGVMRTTHRLGAVVASVAMLAGACGGSSAPSSENAARAGESAPPAAVEPSPTSTYAFAEQPFHEVSRGACVGFERVGSKDTVTLDIHQPKSEVGEFFYPNCLTDVRGDRLTVKIDNNGMIMHNFIVECDDVELIVSSGDAGKIDVELGPGEEIGFQCTIHSNFMFGAFFRKNV